MSPVKAHRHLFLKSIRKTAYHVVQHKVGKSAAALTYYLLFALFPLLVFISNLLGLLDLNIAAISKALMRIMPDDVVNLLETYLYHVESSSSAVMLWFSLVFTVWFPFRAVSSLMDDVRTAYQLGKPTRPITFTIRKFLFTIVFLVIIVVLLLLATFGRRFLSTVITYLGIRELLQLPPKFLHLWQYLRFVLFAVIMLAMLGLLYAAAQDTRPSVKSILPGAASSMIALLIASICFSVYVENFANYSVIYGTLGAVIALLMWLYMTSFILILGAEYNGSLIDVRKEAEENTAQ